MRKMLRVNVNRRRFCKALLLLALSSDALAAGTWSWRELTPTAGLAPEARRNGTAIFDPAGRRIIVFGGTAASGLLNDVWALDLQRGTWQRLQPTGTPPEPRLGHDAVYDPVGHRMIVWAGQQGARFFNDTWALDLTTPQWRNISPAVRPRARYGSASVYDPVARGLVQFAGFTEEGNRFQDTQRFSFAAHQWSDLTPPGNKPQVRCLHTGALDATGRRMIVFGGQRSGALDDLWVFDLDTLSWQEFSPASRPPARFFTSSFVDRGGRFVLFGGATGGGAVNDTWAFDFTTNQWSRIEVPGPPAARSGMMSAWDPVRGRLIVFGGMGSGLFNDVWELRTVDETGPGAQTHFAQMANGDGWSSVFVLTNPSALQTVAGALSLFDDPGAPLAVPIAGQGPASSIAFTLGPFGSVTIATDGSGDLLSGWARLTASGPVAGVVRFTSALLGTAGVGGSVPLSGFISPVKRDQAAGVSTGLAIAAAGSATRVTLRLRNAEGQTVAGGEATLMLEAQGHVARFLEQLFPDADTGNFEGTVTVEVEGGAVVATALLLGNRAGELTTLPVTPLLR